MPTRKEQDVLDKIGSIPIEKVHRAPKLARAEADMQLKVWLRTRQTFVYHVCERIAQFGWVPGCQDVLNECQRELENLYDSPMVELVSMYRKGNTKSDGVCLVLIYKVGPLDPVIDAELQRVKPPFLRAWWERITRNGTAPIKRLRGD